MASGIKGFKAEDFLLLYHPLLGTFWVKKKGKEQNPIIYSITACMPRCFLYDLNLAAYFKENIVHLSNLVSRSHPVL